MTKKLLLRRDIGSELSSGELSGVAGGGPATTVRTCPTLWMTCLSCVTCVERTCICGG